MNDVAQAPQNDMRNITELKHKTNRPGWWVRFKLGKSVQASFSNSEYGGRANALLMAKRFRDAVEREMEPERIRRGVRFGQLTKRSKYGVAGVERVDRPYQKDGYTCRRFEWVAWLPLDDGRRTSIRFSIDKYGEDQARQLAIDARLKAVHEMNTRRFSTFRPPDDDLKMWRYMDFTKFVSMLENQSIFFARASLMDDAFEGGYSRGNEELRELVYKALGPFRHDKNAINKRRKNTVLSCWHGSEHESAAMWKIYSSANESICIQTTFGRLRSLMPMGVEIGRVQYVDYEREWVPERHPILPFLYKRASFAHEQEFRAIRDLTDKTAAGNFRRKPDRTGLWVKCELSSLIEKIYVAPNVHQWFFDLVRSVVDRYEVKVPVCPSSLEAKPNYRSGRTA